jgi:hypothetical protein
VFWILAIGFLVTVQLRTYPDETWDLDQVEDKIDVDEARRKRLKESRVLTGEIFYAWGLLVPNANPKIENREFIDCIVRGPGSSRPRLVANSKIRRLGLAQ